jgi:cytoskeletal protein CcmA (bactofilin family)
MKFRKGMPDEIVSLLGEGVEVVGDISFSRGLRVDGVVKGTIRSEAALVVGAGGRVEAEINVKRASINGEFRGIIHASDRVEIHKEGKVYGEIFAPCLIIEAGALFEGKCNMAESRAPKPEAPAPNPPPPAVAQSAGDEKTWTN